MYGSSCLIDKGEVEINLGIEVLFKIEFAERVRIQLTGKTQGATDQQQEQLDPSYAG